MIKDDDQIPLFLSRPRYGKHLTSGSLSRHRYVASSLQTDTLTRMTRPVGTGPETCRRWPPPPNSPGESCSSSTAASNRSAPAETSTRRASGRSTPSSSPSEVRWCGWTLEGSCVLGIGELLLGDHVCKFSCSMHLLCKA